MKDAAWQDQLPKFVRILQFIVGAMVLGCAVFFGIVLIVHGSRPANAAKVGRADVSFLTWAAFAFLGITAIVRCMVPAAIVRGGRKKIAQGTFRLPQARQASQERSLDMLEQMGDAGKLLVLYQIKTIVGAALIEGATFFLLIAAMIERAYVLPMGTAALLILVIAAHIPTRPGLTHWIEDQLRLVDEERLLGR